MKLKQIFSLMLILFSAATYGQTFSEIRASRVLVNSVLRPGMDTILLNPRDSGTLAFKNGEIYTWTGSRWKMSSANIYNANGGLPNGTTRIMGMGATAQFFISDSGGNSSSPWHLIIETNRLRIGKGSGVTAGVNLSYAEFFENGNFDFFSGHSSGTTRLNSVGGTLFMQSPGMLMTSSGSSTAFTGTSSYSFAGKSFRVSNPFLSSMTYSPGGANVTGDSIVNYYVLGDLTAQASSRTFTPPYLANFTESEKTSAVIRVVNQNIDATKKWNVSGIPIYDVNGSQITQLTDATAYTLMYLQASNSVFGAGWHVVGKASIGAGGALALGDLTNVTITAPTSGQVLKYNGSAWVNDADATGSGGGNRDNNTGTELLKALGSSVKYESFGLSRAEITTALNLSDGLILVAPIWVDTTTTLTGVGYIQGTQGVYTGDNQNRIALFTRSGSTYTEVATTANDTELWKGTANTVKTVAFTSSYVAARGAYYIMCIYNNSAQTTAPSIATYPNLANANMVSSDLSAGARWAAFWSGQATLPTSINNSSLANSNNQAYFFLYQP